MELRTPFEFLVGRLSSVLVTAGFLVVSGAAVAGCGSDSTSGGTTPTDTATGGSDVATGGDTTTAGDTASGGDTTSAQQCCADKGAQCGFVAGCPSSCGSCQTGFQCNSQTNKCVEQTTGPKLKVFGESCGVNEDCPNPPNNATDEQLDEYFQCLNDQCEDGLCVYGVCTKTCLIPSNGDKKNNATGTNGADGIADEGIDAGCDGATDGQAGSAFKCVEFANPAQGSAQRCVAGTTFKACKADGDCPSEEVCGYKFILGNYTTVCQPKFKQADGSPGAKAGEFCNADPADGPEIECANSFCGNFGCLSFCKADTDCPNNGFCEKGVKIFGEDSPGFDICSTKPCFLDTECPTGQFCRTFYNGAESEDGSPDPDDATKVIYPGFTGRCAAIKPGAVKEGEKCDPFPNDDDTTFGDCFNPFWCLDGVCGGHCKADGDCASSQKCTAVEIPIDLDDPQDGTDDVYAPITVCRNYPGAKGDCYGQGDCKGDAAAPYCRMFEGVDLSQQATKTQYTQKGICIAPEAGYADAGQLCGALADATQCKSGLCGFGTETQPGFCLDMCSGKADCPAEVTIGDAKYKMLCRSYLMGWNGTTQPLDDLYAPLCVPVEGTTSLADCSATKKCGTGEVCSAFSIAYGPTKAAKVEYLCVGLGADAKPTKQVGEACNPDAETTECVTGACMPDSETGKGYCSAYCNSNSDCGNGNGLFCDTDHQIIGRADASKAAIAPMCLKKKSCIPCAYDFQCATGTICNWKSKADENGRCAPPCTTDADCAGTDGGAKCEAQSDYAGKPTGAKVCTPTCK